MSNHATIRAIECQFMQHTDELHEQAHHKLDAQHAGVLADVSDAVTGVTNQQDIHSLVTTKTIKDVSEDPKAQQKLQIPFNQSMMLK